MISSIRVVCGFHPSATHLTVIARSVMRPRSLPSLEISTHPTFWSRILRATSAAVSHGEAVTNSVIMPSRTFIFYPSLQLPDNMKRAISSPPTTPPQKQYSPSGRRQDLKGCNLYLDLLRIRTFRHFYFPYPHGLPLLHGAQLTHRRLHIECSNQPRSCQASWTSPATVDTGLSMCRMTRIITEEIIGDTCRQRIVVNGHLHTGLAIVCPVTKTDRGFPFHVGVPNEPNVVGFVMVEQVKSIDYRTRKVKRIGTASDAVLEEVLSILDACIY